MLVAVYFQGQSHFFVLKGEDLLFQGVGFLNKLVDSIFLFIRMGNNNSLISLWLKMNILLSETWDLILQVLDLWTLPIHMLP